MSHYDKARLAAAEDEIKKKRERKQEFLSPLIQATNEIERELGMGRFHVSADALTHLKFKLRELRLLLKDIHDEH